MQIALKTSRVSPAIKYLGLLATATVASVLAGALFWLAELPDILHPNLCQIGSATAGLLAGFLAYMAARSCEGIPAAPQRLHDLTHREVPKKSPVSQPAEPSERKLGSAIERERERLRSGGFSEAEISQILVAREMQGNNGHARGSFGTGVATGVLNNIDAIVTHARSLVPSFRTDFDRIFDPHAGAGARASSAISLTVKTVALLALGYFVYIEALQLRSVAYKSWAEACIERQKNAINFTPMNKLLEPETMKQLNEECSS